MLPVEEAWVFPMVGLQVSLSGKASRATHRPCRAAGQAELRGVQPLGFRGFWCATGWSVETS